MPRKMIKRFMPSHHSIRENKMLKIFGTLLHDPQLWTLHRRNVSGAMAIGLFCAFFPIPGQMVIAAATAIITRVNLPLSVALVWLTNPITIPPVFYFAYLLGARMLDTPPLDLEIELSLEWVSSNLALVWQPLLTGSLTLAILSSCIGFFGTRLLWRLHVVHEWRHRHDKNRKHKHKSKTPHDSENP